jgi:hypothetical protein
MHKQAIAAFICLVFCSLGFAQESQRPPLFEVFGGYSLMHSDWVNWKAVNMNGWNAAVNTNVLPWLGAVADFSGNYFHQTTTWRVSESSSMSFSDSANRYSFLFGPQVSYRHPRAVIFAHSLFGTTHGTLTWTLSQSLQELLGGTASDHRITDSHFTVALGGGVDLNVGHRFAIRPAQADYLYFHNYGVAQNTFRYSAGVVFRFGAR